MVNRSALRIRIRDAPDAAETPEDVSRAGSRANALPPAEAAATPPRDRRRKDFLLILTASSDSSKAPVLFCATPLSLVIISHNIDIARSRD
jgi:hypothetical protein